MQSGEKGAAVADGLAAGGPEGEDQGGTGNIGIAGAGASVAMEMVLSEVRSKLGDFHASRKTLEDSQLRRDELEKLLLRKDGQLEKMRADAGKKGEARRLAALQREFDALVSACIVLSPPPPSLPPSLPLMTSKRSDGLTLTHFPVPFFCAAPATPISVLHHLFTGRTN